MDVGGRMNRLQAMLSHSGRWLAQTVASMLTTIRHPAGGWGFALLNRTLLNYEAMVRPEANSIVQAGIGWAQRNFAEAPATIEHWNPEREDWDQSARDPLLSLLARPNPYYTGAVLVDAAIADYMLTGDGYILKVRSRSGRVVQLWWAPESTIEPKGDPADDTVFISHFEYRPGGGKTSNLRPEDVIHLQDGIDPDNPRKGLSRMKSLFREIFTDDEAANMTAVLLKNMGVPGVIISPKAGTIPPAVGQEMKDKFHDEFSGDRKGDAMVVGGPIEIHQFGFSPEQMQMRSLRGIPEERITAVLGINSVVLNLGSGLASTKVGATLLQYREEATESFMVPLWHQFAQALTLQLVPDFKGDTEDWRLVFDLSKVRALQEDEARRAENLNKRLQAGGITVAEYRRALGMVVRPEHEIYLRASSVKAVPAGLSPEEQAAATVEPTARDIVEAEVERALAVRAAEHVLSQPVALPLMSGPQRSVQTITRDKFGRIQKVSTDEE